MTDTWRGGRRWPPANSRLVLIDSFVKECEALGVRYCHWKSNEHLLAAVAGDTDLDVLFDEAARSKVLEALAATGFRSCRAVWHRRYPYIEDYLAVDAESGKLVHVHAHFRLVVGEEAAKSFHLPWEDELLDTRHWDEQFGFYAAEPAREMLLLLVRSAIKRQYPSLRRRILWRRASIGLTDDQREFAWLKERVTLSSLTDLALRLLGTRAVSALEALYAGGPHDRDLAALFVACNGMGSYRRRGRVGTLLVRWTRWVAGFSLLVGRRLGFVARPSRRTVVNGGLIVAILGADGSGKSTLVKGLDTVLSKKLDVLRLYLGSGDGPSSLLRWPLVKLHRWRQRWTRTAASAQSSKESRALSRSSLWGNAKWVERIYWALSLALEKRSKLRRAVRARAAGKIVVTDRYPQSSISGYNDGPLLRDLASSTWLLMRTLSRWEHMCYGPDRVPQPDLVLKLVGSPDVLHDRRPDLAPDAIDRKQRGILEVAFDRNTRVVEVDADRPAEEVLARAMTSLGAVLAIRCENPDGSIQ